MTDFILGMLPYVVHLAWIGLTYVLGTRLLRMVEIQVTVMPEKAPTVKAPSKAPVKKAR